MRVLTLQLAPCQPQARQTGAVCCSAPLTKARTASCLQLGQAALRAVQQAAAQLSAVLSRQFFVQWCTAVFAVMARLQARGLPRLWPAWSLCEPLGAQVLLAESVGRWARHYSSPSGSAAPPGPADEPWCLL